MLLCQWRSRKKIRNILWRPVGSTAAMKHPQTKPHFKSKLK